MLYVYKCLECGNVADRVCSVEERLTPFLCDMCDSEMSRVPSFTGGLKTEHPPWLDHHVKAALCDPGGPQISTRTEHDKLCRERGIAHK
jgi:hypothetical protein